MDPKPGDALRIVRILKISFIVAGLLFFYLAFKIPSKVTVPPKPAVGLVISAFALSIIVLGFVLPGFKMRAVRRGNPNVRSTATPIQSWMSGCILSLAFFQSATLFAFVLHFTNAEAIVVDSLFAAGLLAMLFWSPGTPPTDHGASPTQEFPSP